MPCKTCGGNKAKVLRTTVVRPAQPQIQSNEAIADNDMVLITYMNQNRGMHKVVGAQTKINYGYRQGGGVEHFYVHKSDIATHPDWFQVYEPPKVVQTRPVVPLTQAPVLQDEEPNINILEFVDTQPASQSQAPGQLPLNAVKPLDLQSIPGVTDKIAEGLTNKGVKTWGDIVAMGLDGLQTVEGIGEKRAHSIMAIAKKNMG